MLRLQLDRMSRFWHVSVKDTYQGRLESVAHYVDPWYELAARLVVRPSDYRVEEAVVDLMRGPLGKRGSQRRVVDSLRGTLAYAGIGRAAKKATQDDTSGLQAGLFLECVKALRQARLFVWEREGIDPAEHLDLIERLLLNGCVFYSFPGALRAVLHPKQLDQMRRWDWLFSRHKFCVAERGNDEKRVKVGLSDSYHEMQLQLVVRTEAVHRLEGTMERAPHEECFLAEATLDRLRGARLAEGPGAWEARLAGPEGCAHLADLAREACASVRYWDLVEAELDGRRSIAQGSR